MDENKRDHREFDLFGKPVRPRKGQRGRPPLELDDSDFDMVEAGLARGWSNERIMNTLGVGKTSFHKYFANVLKFRPVATDRLRLAVFARTAREALEGNMSAVKRLQEMMDADAREAAARRMQDDQDSDDEGRQEQIGKKEAARRAAENALKSDGWGDLLNPKGPVN